MFHKYPLSGSEVFMKR